ncbi:hypothetical protein MKW92_001875 [Papaver armeniacum]|nr:hypothetical protein MKW92_001875 [Papaver armeniacum]
MHGMVRMRVSSFLRVGSKTLDLMEELFSPPSLRSYLSEFISSFIFVFVGVGSAISAGKLMTSSDAQSRETGLLAVGVAHAFGFTVAVYVSPGSHVNPAVTFAFVIVRKLSILTGICHLITQLLGSTLACLLLMLVTAGQAIPTHGLDDRVTVFGGILIEGVATFTLVYTVFASRDPQRRSSDGIIGAIVTGFIAGVNILAVGPFTGCSMNPARSFGPSIITSDFKNHWVYWLGPLIGGGLAGLLYDKIISSNHNQSSSEP